MQLDSTLQHAVDATAVVEVQEQSCLRVLLGRDLLHMEVNHLKKVIADLEWRGVCLSYKDVKPGGRLDGSMEHFTSFPDVDGVISRPCLWDPSF